MKSHCSHSIRGRPRLRSASVDEHTPHNEMEPVAAALSALVVSSGALEPDAQQEAVLAQLQASGVLADIDADRADKIAMGMLFECKAIQVRDPRPRRRAEHG